jgi:penicillin-binding protein 2
MILTRDGDWAKMFTRRALVLAGTQGVLVSALIGRLYYLQIIESDRYKVLADGNRINVQLLPPPRGRILDRFGYPMAENSQQFRVLINPEQTNFRVGDTLAEIAQLIELTDYERERVKKEVGRHRGFVPITVKENLSWEEMARIQVNAPELPGVSIEQALTRSYPLADAAAHLLGYVSSVDEADLNNEQADPLLQLPGFRIGKAGVEKVYDTVLRGKGGTRQVEVNAYGREVRELERHEGEAGEDLLLTIDERIQRFAADSINKRLPVQEQSCALNVMDIYTGEMLAMLSCPGFDPHIFARKPTPQEWQELSTDPRAALTNKSVAGRYSPGSTFKMCVALAALENGVIAPEQTVHCVGHTTLGSNTWYCWQKGGHGSVDMVTAIAQSCDCYFYEVARRLGVDRIAAMAKKLNLGELTGIGLPGEQKGLVPTEAWKKANRGEPWQQGETLNVGIGQGQVNVTPIQLLTYVSRIANGGLAVKPTLIRATASTAAVVAAIVRDNTDGAPNAMNTVPSLGIAPQHLAIIQRGMLGALSPGGTAPRSAIVMTDPDKRDWKMAGKTGSAQSRRISRAIRQHGEVNQDTIPWDQRDNALFIGFAPYHAPRYAASCIIEHGKAGRFAALIVKDVMEEVLRLDPSRKPRQEDQVATAQPPVQGPS